MHQYCKRFKLILCKYKWLHGKKEILFVKKADTSSLVSGLMREITIFQYLEISSQNMPVFCME